MMIHLIYLVPKILVPILRYFYARCVLVTTFFNPITIRHMCNNESFGKNKCINKIHSFENFEDPQRPTTTNIYNFEMIY